jgi:hypothetical protein
MNAQRRRQVAASRAAVALLGVKVAKGVRVRRGSEKFGGATRRSID